MDSEEKKNAQIDRISYYENLMQRASETIASGTASAAGFARLQENLKKLSSYYGSAEWKKDFADDEAGLLPSDLKRGVLSEDGIYDLLDEGKEWTSSVLESLLDKDYWIVDLLPRQVAKYQDGQYFEIEKYYLESPRIDSLRKKYAELFIKLNCYYDICVCLVRQSDEGPGGWTVNPAPNVLEGGLSDERFGTCSLYVVIPGENVLCYMSGSDTYMTVYNPSEELLKLMRALASGEGLYVWKPEN